LRRILPIISIILFSAICSQGQSLGANDPIVKFYPNPATTYISFDLQKSAQRSMTVQVYNLLGKKMYEGRNLPEKTTINLADYTRGVYIYHLLDQAGKVIESGKFQVSK
jgi:hypothetical protein